MSEGYILSLLALIFFVSGLAQGLTGFGFGIVAMALLPLMMDIRECAPIVTFIGAIGITTSIWVHREDVAWPETWRLLAGITMGAPLGIMILSAIPHGQIARLLGATLVGTCLVQVLVPKHQKLVVPKYLGLPLGVISGMLGGAFNMGGPPALIYLQGRPLPVDAMIASLQIAFGFSLLLRSGMIIAGGLVNQTVLMSVAIGIVPALLGIGLSTRFRELISEKTVRIVMTVAMFLMGLKYLAF